jgi:DNA-binding transcriptional ArsR family regulator
MRYGRRMDSVLAAISDESRRTVLSALSEGPATVTELAALLPIARPGVSRHLRVLREAGLVDVRPDAQRRVYSLRPQPLAELDEWLEPYRALWTNRLDALHTEIARGQHLNKQAKNKNKKTKQKKTKKIEKRKKNG